MVFFQTHKSNAPVVENRSVQVIFSKVPTTYRPVKQISRTGVEFAFLFFCHFEVILANTCGRSEIIIDLYMFGQELRVLGKSKCTLCIRNKLAPICKLDE